MAHVPCDYITRTHSYCRVVAWRHLFAVHVYLSVQPLYPQTLFISFSTMYIWGLFDLHGLVFLISLLAAASHALPVHDRSLQSRGHGNRKCGDHQRGPCICTRSRGIRDPSVATHCGTAAYQFEKPEDLSDGKVHLASYCFF
jgi:hypothetical protein